MVLTDEPKTLMLDGALAAGFVLRAPLPVRVWQEGEEYVADASEVNVHAFGPDEEGALANLRVQIVEHLAFLDEMGDNLAPGLTADRQRLRSLLIPARG